MAISIIFNLMQIGWFAAAGHALGYDVPFSYYILVIPFLSLAILLPSIGGLGIREGLAPLLFASAGLSSEQAVALTLLVFAIERLSGFLGEADLSVRVAEILFTAWPKEVAGPISEEVGKVLTSQHRGLHRDLELGLQLPELVGVVEPELIL